MSTLLLYSYCIAHHVTFMALKFIDVFYRSSFPECELFKEAQDCLDYCFIPKD